VLRVTRVEGCSRGHLAGVVAGAVLVSVLLGGVAGLVGWVLPSEVTVARVALAFLAVSVADSFTLVYWCRVAECCGLGWRAAPWYALGLIVSSWASALVYAAVSRDALWYALLLTGVCYSAGALLGARRAKRVIEGGGCSSVARGWRAATA